MSEVELAQRFIACRARIPGDRLRKGQVAQKDWPKVVRACNELEKAPLWIDDSSDLGHARPAGEGAAPARAGAGARAGSALMIVDYLQLMRADDPRANRVEQVGQMSRGLKILARELEDPGDRDLASSPAPPSSGPTSGRSSPTCASPGRSSRTPTWSPSSTATSTTTTTPRTRGSPR